MLARAGVGIVVAMVVTAVALRIVRTAITDQIEVDVRRQAVESLLGRLFETLFLQTATLIALGLVIALGAWPAGPARLAVRLRGRVRSLGGGLAAATTAEPSGVARLLGAAPHRRASRHPGGRRRRPPPASRTEPAGDRGHGCADARRHRRHRDPGRTTSGISRLTTARRTAVAALPGQSRTWIGETQRERKTLLAQLNSPLHSEELTADQVRALVEALRDVMATLGDANPADKTELYRALGVALSYNPGAPRAAIMPVRGAAGHDGRRRYVWPSGRPDRRIGAPSSTHASGRARGRHDASTGSFSDSASTAANFSPLGSARSVGSDDAELVPSRIPEHPCGPIACLRMGQHRSAGFLHLVDERLRMLDKEVEVNSRLARLRLWNRLKCDQRRPVRTTVPSFQRDVRPTGRRWPARVAQTALPGRSQQCCVGTIDRDADLIRSAHRFHSHRRSRMEPHTTSGGCRCRSNSDRHTSLLAE